jgi:hypothetical protein
MTKPAHIATLSIPDHAQVARGTLRALIGRAGLTIDDPRRLEVAAAVDILPIDYSYDPDGLNSERSIDSPIAL